MDQAVYASTASLIVGIRGNRVFQASPITGALLGTPVDLGTFGRNGCIAYESVNNKIFAAVWNTPWFANDSGTLVSNRTIYRLSPTTLGIEAQRDVVTLLSLQSANLAAMESGVCALDASGGKVYCRYFQCHTPPGTGGFSGGSARFNFDFTGVQNDNSGLVGGYPNIVYGTVGGDACSIYPDQSTPQVIIYDWGTTSETVISVAAPKVMLAVGFAPDQQHVFVTDVAQFIYVYNTGGGLVSTINTGRSAFNGLAVRRNPTTGLMYVPGGSDNTIAVIDPATNILTLKSGFDCPVDIVAAGALTFAVQSGSTPLKLIT